MGLKKVSSGNFDKKVLKSKGVVAVKFTATWCGPCQILSPVLQEIASELPEVQFYEVDIDTDSDLADDYKVTAVPTTVVFKNGKPKKKIKGVQKKSKIIQVLQEL